MLSEIAALTDLINAHQPIVVLTGAGISTESGIPAYRNAAGEWIHAKPVQARDFLQHHEVRQRYWHRSMLGWPAFNAAMPNRTHDILTTLESRKTVSCVITQNVDGLHDRSGSLNVIELHGSLATAICLSCGQSTPREDIQRLLLDYNPSFRNQEFAAGADGDATPIKRSSSETNAAFKIVNCPNCKGILKPDVVFYGENVPVSRVNTAMAQLAGAGMLLCLGTSLTVFSGFRFCRKAHQQGIPIAIVNLGTTRADDIADCIVNSDCTTVLLEVLTGLQS